MSELNVASDGAPRAGSMPIPEPSTDPAKCFLCNTVSERVVWKESSGYEARLCSCGLLYSHPKPRDGSVDYSEDIHPREFYSYPAKFKANWMARHCPRGRLLEVGCGTGSFLAAAQAHGYQVFGLEPHSERANLARRLGISVEQNFLENNTLPKASFDVVYHCDLLAHFPDPVKALQEMSSLLRPGGVLCFEVGFVAELSPIWFRFIEFMGGLELGSHLWLFSERSLRLLLQTAELDIEHTTRFGLAPTVVEPFLRRLVAPGSVGRQRVHPHSERGKKLRFFRYYFLRYRVGAMVSGFGPQTAFVVARPQKSVVTH